MPRIDVPTGRRPLPGPTARGAAILALALAVGRHGRGGTAEAQDRGRLPQPEVRPPRRDGLSRRRQQPPVRRRAAPGQDPVVPQRARTRPTRQLFLQLPDPINRGNEEGLLGLAFHPKYKENGEFFVYYSAKKGDDRRSVVSRFRVSKDDPRKADPASEERIWVSAKDPFENHNGGCIAFGPDGYLYISLGDSGAADDPLTTGQNPTDWFGSILRIDVDHPADGKPYGIPKDNPRLRDPKFADWAPEVYCIGLRNVWKFSFDRETGDALGRRRRPEQVGDGPRHRERRQLRLEHPARGSTRSSPRGRRPTRSSQITPADRRVSPRPERRPEPQGLRPEHHRRLRLPRQGPARAGRRLRLRRLRHRPDLGPPRGKDGKAVAVGELIDIGKPKPS